jgi:hypothetical protein
VCLLRGTSWVFISDRSSFVLKRFMVKFSLLYNRAGRNSVVYNFIVILCRDFCGLNTLFIMPVIFK